MGRTKKELTGPEFIIYLDELIERAYGGNKTRAATALACTPAAVYDILGGRRGPTKDMLKLMKFTKKTVAYYEEM